MSYARIGSGWFLHSQVILFLSVFEIVMALLVQIWSLSLVKVFTIGP